MEIVILSRIMEHINIKLTKQLEKLEEGYLSINE
jgi:hypothetical protein